MKPLSLGLLGQHLGHSFSRAYFTQKFQEQRLLHTYTNHEVASAKLLGSWLRNVDLDGFNVTIPYKQDIIQHLDGLSPLAQRIGAVNTVVHTTTGYWGHNTDYTGVQASLSELWKSDYIPRVVLLGYGGAAKAVQVCLQDLGWPYTVVVRDITKVESHEDVLNLEQLQGRLGQYDLIINTTPLGTWPNVSELPPVPVDELSAQHHLLDLIYNPAETALMQAVQVAGGKAMNGYLMLVTQAEEAFAIWSGSKPLPR